VNIIIIALQIRFQPILYISPRPFSANPNRQNVSYSKSEIQFTTRGLTLVALTAKSSCASLPVCDSESSRCGGTHFGRFLADLRGPDRWEGLTCTALINIRPATGNRSMEIKDPGLRSKIQEIDAL
jgi:hypothetical protein